jgi:hypothetical protein
MCKLGTSDESFQNHHYLAGTGVTVKLALLAGPLGQLFGLSLFLTIGEGIRKRRLYEVMGKVGARTLLHESLIHNFHFNWTSICH